MLMGDLMTIAQYNLPIKLIVFNNHSLGMVELEMQVAGLPDWQTKMTNPDFAMVAEAWPSQWDDNANIPFWTGVFVWASALLLGIPFQYM